MILLRGTRFSQPIGAAEIDYGHPLSLGLIQAVSGGATRYSCGNFSITSSKKTTTTYGLAESTTLNQLLPATQKISGTDSSFTLLSIELVSSSVASTACIYKLGNASNAGRAWVSSADGTTAGAISATIYLGAYRTLGGSFVKPVGSMYIGVLRHSHGVGASLFVDGAEDPVNALFTNTSLGHGFLGVRDSPTGCANALSVVWNRALSNAEIAEISRNPWQLFRPAQRRIYFDMGAGGGVTTHTVTAAPAKLGGTTTRPGLTQAHIVTARPVAQGGTVTRPGLTQTHTVTARAVTQSSVVNAPSVDVGSTPATFVTARPVAQGSTVNAPSIRQTHVTSARAAVQGSTINAPGLVQTHVVTARPVAQASTVRVAGIAPPFVRSIYWEAVPSEKFSAAVPSEKFSAAVPRGNQ